MPRGGGRDAFAQQLRELVLTLDNAKEEEARVSAAQQLNEFVQSYFLVNPEQDLSGPGRRSRNTAVSAALRSQAPRTDDPLEAQIRSAIEQFRSSDGEARTGAQQRLKGLIEQYFDRDVERREAEVADIVGQVKKLREQLDRRRQKREELIDLQMKLIENESEGMGFFSSPTAAGPIPPPTYDWFGRPIPPGGAQSMNPPAARDWYGRPIERAAAPAAETNVPPAGFPPQPGPPR
jgi:hypothetical protein